MTDTSRPLRPRSFSSARPWAGVRLGAPDEHVGERWVAGPDSVVAVDARELTLDALTTEWGEALVGRRGMALRGGRFPLLVKLIDAADWLSLQVHPSDAVAVELVGPDAVGKAEAWVVIEADAAAEMVVGPRPGLDEARLRDRIADGSLGLDDCERATPTPGDVLMLGAGTMHAIGPGLFIYEIEQPSDLTFRISDWGRPATPGRRLHPRESLRAIRPVGSAERVGRGWRIDGGALTVPEFRLELVTGSSSSPRNPGGESLEVLTAVRGSGRVAGDGWDAPLGYLETLVVPAAAGAYEVIGTDDAVICLGSIP